jgi:glycosyltransferase involved in cell wall biosynthesis
MAMTVAHSVTPPASVSVVMPAYNARTLVAQALGSVLDQGAAVREVIVVDDGSTDGTPALVRNFDPRVHLIEQQNAGPAAARNRGLAAASGEYLAFCDADDLWLPGKLDAQLAHLSRHPDLKMVYGRISYWYEDENGAYSDLSAQEVTPSDREIDGEVSGYIYPELLLDSAIHIITSLIHRSVYERVGGFDETLRTGEDYDFWLRVSRHFEMHKLSRYLARYRLHRQSTTKAPRAESNELKVLLRAIERFGTQGPDGREVDPLALQARIGALWFGHGYLHFWRGDARIARHAFAHATQYRHDMKCYAYRVLSAVGVFPGPLRRLLRSGGGT